MSSSGMDEISSCPGDETLAAFVDDRLEAGARQEVVAHLASCADCRDIVLIASRAAAAGDSKVVRPDFRRRYPPLIAVAAAAVLVLIGIPGIRERILPGDPMSDIAAVAETAPLRASPARLSIDVAFKPANETMRGDADEGASLSAEQALAEAKERAERSPTADNLHALGVASLLNGRPHEAVSALEAARRASQSPSAALLIDLSAAYYLSGNYLRAVDVASEALKVEKQTPGAYWNRALALEALSRDDEALRDWKQFQALEADPAWDAAADEAMKDFKPVR